MLGPGADEAARKALERGTGAVVVRTQTGEARVFTSQTSGGTLVAGFEIDGHTSPGAGAAFNAGFLFSYGRSASIKESARFANATAALVASAPRGILDAPTEKAVRELMRDA
jgi:sugar/nucleoside kinase (ribokinase family)